LWVAEVVEQKLDVVVIAVVGDEHKDGIGKNKRTAEYIGGGAVLGTIIGAIAGGKKGAAIGAVAGAGAGVGAQVLTRGKKVNVPAESLLSLVMLSSKRAPGGILQQPPEP
jgi:hypothetical protein